MKSLFLSFCLIILCIAPGWSNTDYSNETKEIFKQLDKAITQKESYQLSLEKRLQHGNDNSNMPVATNVSIYANDWWKIFTCTHKPTLPTSTLIKLPIPSRQKPILSCKITFACNAPTSLLQQACITKLWKLFLTVIVKLSTVTTCWHIIICYEQSTGGWRTIRPTLLLHKNFA